MIAILAGATGLTGNAILEFLKDKPEISRIRAFVRKPGVLGTHEKLEELVLPEGGFATLLKQPRGEKLKADFYFCALGTTHKKAGSKEAFRAVDLEAVVDFAKLAEAEGAKAFGLVSASGASLHSPFHYSRVKAEAEAQIARLAIPTKVFIRPSLLIGERKESRPAERVSIDLWKSAHALLPARVARELGSPVTDVARILVDACLVLKPGVRIIEARDLN
jgi:uncharacterized protein YbjT (DUF2867 family)